MAVGPTVTWTWWQRYLARLATGLPAYAVLGLLHAPWIVLVAGSLAGGYGGEWLLRAWLAGRHARRRHPAVGIEHQAAPGTPGQT